MTTHSTDSSSDGLAFDRSGVRPTSPQHRSIYCTGCETEVQARLTDGQEHYPSRPDLYAIPFWRCDTCGAWVGCHWKTEKPTTPLGYLATPQIMNARKKIHRLLDPMWKSGKMQRRHLYSRIGKELGHPYHNGEIKTLDEAREIYKIVARIHNELLTEATEVRK